jgi:IS30 family transposase
MNDLVRQYLSKGTDFSVYSQEELDAVADVINNRPLKG